MGVEDQVNALRSEVREGFAGVHTRIDTVQETLSTEGKSLAVTEERLDNHIQDNNRHKSASSPTPGVNVRVIMAVAAGLTAIAGVVAAISAAFS